MDDPTTLQTAIWALVALLAGGQGFQGVRWFFNRKNGDNPGSLSDEIIQAMERVEKNRESTSMQREIHQALIRLISEMQQMGKRQEKLVERQEKLIQQLERRPCQIET